MKSSMAKLQASIYSESLYFVTHDLDAFCYKNDITKSPRQLILYYYRQYLDFPDQRCLLVEQDGCRKMLIFDMTQAKGRKAYKFFRKSLHNYLYLGFNPINQEDIDRVEVQTTNNTDTSELENEVDIDPTSEISVVISDPNHNHEPEASLPAIESIIDFKEIKTVERLQTDQPVPVKSTKDVPFLDYGRNLERVQSNQHKVTVASGTVRKKQVRVDNKLGLLLFKEHYINKVPVKQLSEVYGPSEGVIYRHFKAIFKTLEDYHKSLNLELCVTSDTWPCIEELINRNRKKIDIEFANTSKVYTEKNKTTKLGEGYSAEELAKYPPLVQDYLKGRDWEYLSIFYNKNLLEVMLEVTSYIPKAILPRSCSQEQILEMKNLWINNPSMGIRDLADKYKISRSTVARYLKIPADQLIAEIEMLRIQKLEANSKNEKARLAIKSLHTTLVTTPDSYTIST